VWHIGLGALVTAPADRGKPLDSVADVGTAELGSERFDVIGVKGVRVAELGVIEKSSERVVVELRGVYGILGGRDELSMSMRADFGGTSGGVPALSRDFEPTATLSGLGDMFWGMTRERLFGENGRFGDSDRRRRASVASAPLKEDEASMLMECSAFSSGTGPGIEAATGSPKTFLLQLWYPGALIDLS
jgi:hypothetical protein